MRTCEHLESKNKSPLALNNAHTQKKTKKICQKFVKNLEKITFFTELGPNHDIIVENVDCSDDFVLRMDF